MFSWLINLPEWFQIIFSISLIIPIIYVAIQFIKVLVLAIKQGSINFKSGTKSISIGPSAEGAGQYSSPHKTCPYSKDIIILLHESSKLIQEKDLILYIQQIREQMNYAEQKGDQIKSLLQKVYLSYLEDKGVEKLVKGLSFNTYKLVLRDVTEHVLGIIRSSFRENHFDEMNEQAFGVYVTEKFNYILSEVTELLNTLYFYEEDISREELYNLNQIVVPQVKDMVVDIYQQARSLAVSNKVKLKELDERIERQVGLLI